MVAGPHVDQLHGDTDLVAGFPDAAFDHILGPKIARDL